MELNKAARHQRHGRSWSRWTEKPRMHGSIWQCIEVFLWGIPKILINRKRESSLCFVYCVWQSCLMCCWWGWQFVGSKDNLTSTDRMCPRRNVIGLRTAQSKTTSNFVCFFLKESTVLHSIRDLVYTSLLLTDKLRVDSVSIVYWSTLREELQLELV